MHMVHGNRLGRLLASGAGAVLILVCTAGNAICGLHHGVAWYSEAPNDAVRQLAAQRYEVGITGLTSGSDRLGVKTLKPSFRWFVYNSITDNYVPPHPGDVSEHDFLFARAAAHGWNPEEVYLHYWDDTRIVLQGDTVLVPGWGGGSASDPTLSRVPVFYSSLVRRATNFCTFQARQLHKETSIGMLLDLPFPGTSLYADGIFFDNSSGRLFNRGTILSGGHVREMANHDHIDSAAFRTWYFDTFTQFLGEFRDTLETSAGWSKDGHRKELMINIANVWDDTYVTRGVADVLFMEFLFNPVRDWGITAVDEAYRRDSLAAAAGITSFYSATMTRSVSGKPGQYDYDDTLLGNFAWYLLSRTSNTLFYQQGTNLPSTAGWDTLTWRGVMDVAPPNLGEPQGSPFTLASGTDPLGNPYEIKARNYQGGLVVLRNRGNWSEGIEVTTAVDVNLPATMIPLTPDGNPLAGVNHVVLRNGQGGIFLRGPVPVRLLSFQAERASEGAWIRWETADTTPDHSGFHVYREEADGSRSRLTSALLSGSTAYAWLDRTPPATPTRYWLAELSRTGETSWYGPAILGAIEVGASMPLLAQNQPNPFQAGTTIRFAVTEQGRHTLLVYDVAGREVARLLDGTPALGTQEVRWEGRDDRGRRLPPGIYIYSLRTPTTTLTRKLLLTR